ncbi:hypothetical protein K6U06_17770 [Acidiferrimicrobium sp. IK]|uniref:hypothetical protein n=1 Tax=Acidiferrimicrobium sp. IK TaxID=2871700 RepID=UPI0021CB1DC7|nr:hypothetical protein [Acidiferrimicrobium sp. IK]MCU4186219.1 hypothetical protein [Acidiferrimicrobium sp. IK]
MKTGDRAGAGARPHLEQRSAEEQSASDLRRCARKLPAVVGALGVVAAATVPVADSSGIHPKRITTGALAATGPPVTVPAGSGPAAGEVAAGRFTRTVILDGGALTIRPAPRDLALQITQAKARVLVGSDTRVQGSGWDGDGGLAEVSIVPGLASGVQDMPAWVAVIKQGTLFCPLMRSATAVAATAPVRSWSPGYLVVVVEGGGTKVLNYRSRSQVCDFRPEGPSVSSAAQSVSIPWQMISLQGQTLTFRYQRPACDPYLAGISGPSLSAGGNARTGRWSMEAVIEAPYTLTYSGLLGCGGPWATATTGIGPILGGPGQYTPPVNVVSHAPTGPVGAST